MKDRPGPRGKQALVASLPSLWALIWLTMAASVSSLFVIFWFDYQAARIEQDKFEQSAKLLAAGLANSMENSVILRDYAELEARLKLALSDEQVVSAAVTDNKGQVLSQVERTAGGETSTNYAMRTLTLPAKTPLFQQSGNNALFWTSVGSKRPVGYMRFEFQKTQAELSLRNLRKKILSLSLAGAILMIGFLSLLIKRFRNLFKAREEHLIAAHSELMDVAYYDSLTGLPNRRLFRELLSQEIAICGRTEQMFAIVFCDLDGFKEINDTLGHDAGDQVLIAFGRHFVQSLRQSDTVSRFGGDEFVLLLRDISSRSKCREVMDRVMQVPKELNYVNGHEIECALSAGVALYPIDGETEQSLLGNADKAMYQSKKTKNNSYTFHSPDATMQRD